MHSGTIRGPSACAPIMHDTACSSNWSPPYHGPPAFDIPLDVLPTLSLAKSESMESTCPNLNNLTRIGHFPGKKEWSWLFNCHLQVLTTCNYYNWRCTHITHWSQKRMIISPGLHVNSLSFWEEFWDLHFHFVPLLFSSLLCHFSLLNAICSHHHLLLAHLPHIYTCRCLLLAIQHGKIHNSDKNWLTSISFIPWLSSSNLPWWLTMALWPSFDEQFALSCDHLISNYFYKMNLCLLCPSERSFSGWVYFHGF